MMDARRLQREQEQAAIAGTPIRSDLDFNTRGVGSVEDLIRLVQPQAEQMIGAGGAAAEEQLGLGFQRSIEPLLGTAERGAEALTE